MRPHLDQLIIKDLRIEMSAGIYEHEKIKKQTVIFNLMIDVETNSGRKLSSINDLVSYERIVLDIEKIASDQHYDLLEELAERIAEYCLNFERVLCIDLRLEKPDIMEQTGSVGIRIVRTKNN